jgi:hypothetical protein
MSVSPVRGLACEEDVRRDDLAARDDLHGIDYLEVVTAPAADNQFVLELQFIEKDTAAGHSDLLNLLDDLENDPGRISITGGARVRDPQVTGAEAQDTRLRVRVSQRGDFSTYTLAIRHARLDPVYAEVDFSFKAGCPSRFDCGPRDECPPEERREPRIDYMAKDYASFRQALLDLIPTLRPGWDERHEADLGIALAELLAYAGDQLSYFQDAVATEAYLETARRRVSVRRHARLIDYLMHDGVSARVFVHVHIDEAASASERSGRLARGSQFLTRIGVPLRLGAPLQNRPPPHPTRLDPALPPATLASARAASAAVFESTHDADLSSALNRLRIYPWDRRECCLPAGTTSLHVRGDVAYEEGTTRIEDWRLRPGSFLLLEEVMGPFGGLAADADPTHRQVVRLTHAERVRDPLQNVELTRLEWAREDALTFPLCISSRDPDGTRHDNVSLGRGNLVLADHGETRAEWHPENPGWFETLPSAPGPGIEVTDRPRRFRLSEGPLSRRIPTPADDPTHLQPVAGLLEADPERALPQVRLLVGTDPGSALPWTPAAGTLLEGDAFATSFAVETDEGGRATIRFGDDVNGMAPPDESFVLATYRIGLGRAGNLGAEAISHVIPAPGSGGLLAIESIRNPIPAWGGTNPEPIAEVKRLAPDAFRAVIKRAVTEEDYAKVTQFHRAVQRAVATFRWTGSWHTVFLTVDPVAGVELTPSLRAEIVQHVAAYTQTGYDLEVQGPIYVPLEIEIDVCADREHFRSDVEQAAMEALSSRVLPGGRRGFFHPDNFTFGDPLYLSALYAAVEAVDGVDSATVRTFRQVTEYEPDITRPVTTRNIERGFIPAERLQVLRLDNDPSRPENGFLRLRMGGGK